MRTLQMNISDEFAAKIDSLQKRTGLSMKDIFVGAIGTFDAVQIALESGRSLPILYAATGRVVDIVPRMPQRLSADLH